MIPNRTQLAESLVRRLLADDTLSSHEGVFLAGPPSIGKTTFLREDLVPQLKKSGAAVIFVELTGCDGKKATRKVYAAVNEFLKAAAVDMAGSSQGKFIWSFDPDKVGEEDGETLAYALTEAVRRLGRHIVLILDGIEVWPRTESGIWLLKNLKAARDAVNIRRENDEGTYLHIVGVSSDRELVREMTARTSQPFFGADAEDFPMPGEDFGEARTKRF